MKSSPICVQEEDKILPVGLPGIPSPLFKMRTTGFGLIILFLNPKDHPEREICSLKDESMGSMVPLNNKGKESLSN